jgi:hypothetical protein
MPAALVRKATSIRIRPSSDMLVEIEQHPMQDEARRACSS